MRNKSSDEHGTIAKAMDPVRKESERTLETSRWMSRVTIFFTHQGLNASYKLLGGRAEKAAVP